MLCFKAIFMYIFQPTTEWRTNRPKWLGWMCSVFRMHFCALQSKAYNKIDGIDNNVLFILFITKKFLLYVYLEKLRKLRDKGFLSEHVTFSVIFIYTFWSLIFISSLVLLSHISSGNGKSQLGYLKFSI